MAATGSGESTGPIKGESASVEPTRAQQAVARRVAESKATVPHLILGDDALLGDEIANGPPLTALAVSAAGLALRAYPDANAAYRDARFERFSRINVGVAIDAQGGIVIPTIFDADEKPAEQIAAEIERLAARAVAGEITPPELSGATFTVWVSEARRIAPVIVPPQAAAIGVGAVRPDRSVELTLACDHRILYGAPAAALLAAIRAGLER